VLLLNNLKLCTKKKKEKKKAMGFSIPMTEKKGLFIYLFSKYD
jgi:hypothetical protein